MLWNRVSKISVTELFFLCFRISWIHLWYICKKSLTRRSRCCRGHHGGRRGHYRGRCTRCAGRRCRTWGLGKNRSIFATLDLQRKRPMVSMVRMVWRWTVEGQVGRQHHHLRARRRWGYRGIDRIWSTVVQEVELNVGRSEVRHGCGVNGLTSIGRACTDWK